MRVAICGPMASGKSNLAQRLIEGHHFQRVSLARGVKLVGDRVIEALIQEGVVSADQKGVKQRRMLQAIGAAGREIDPTMWIDDVLREAESHQHVVVDDLRFVNEARVLAENDFILVRLDFQQSDQQKERLQKAYPNDWERHWGARNDVSEVQMAEIPESLINLKLMVEDGDSNWDELSRHLWLT